MNIVFEKIVLSNFMSFGYDEVDLSSPGFTLVSGVNKNLEDSASSNGSGKSSIWEAIAWVLTGNTIRGCKNVSNSNGNDGALVELTCKVDGKEYIITRTKDHSKLKSSLKILIDGVDKSGKGIRDSEKLLAEYLPEVTSSLIGSVIILGQGLPQRFTSNTPSGRKEVLEKLSNSDFMIEDIKSRINQRMIKFNQDKKEEEQALIKHTTQKEMCEKSNKQIEDKLSGLQDISQLTSVLQTIKDCITKVSDDKNSIDEEVTKLQQTRYAENDVLLVLMSKKTFEVEKITNEYSDTLNDLTEQINEQKRKIAVIKSEINRKESITDVCPTCGQKLQGVEKPDTTKDKSDLMNAENLLSQLEDAHAHYKNELNDKINECKKEFDDEISKSKDALQLLDYNLNVVTNEQKNKENELHAYLIKENSIENQIESHDMQKQELETQLQSNNKEIDDLSAKILYNNNVIEDINSHLAVLNKFNTIIKRDFRGILLKNVIDFLNIKSKEYCKDVFNHSNIEFALDGNNVSITINGKEYEQLSGGEKQKIDIIIQLAIRDMLCKYMDFSSNIFVLDEIFDNLDEAGSEKILNLISKRLEDVSSIYIVTHHSSIQIPVDQELLIVKDSNGISRIER